MPFVARLKSTGARVCLEDYRNPKAELPPHDLVCQFEDCGGALLIRSGLRVRPHFAHRPSAPCGTRFESHPESAAHRHGKRVVAEWLRKDCEANGFASVRIEFEVAIKEAGRVADVLVTFPSGSREAHEIQIASITPQDLQRRTDAYRNEGIDVVWWLGEGSSADNRANRQWVLDQCGECVLLSFHHLAEASFDLVDPSVGASGHGR